MDLFVTNPAQMQHVGRVVGIAAAGTGQHLVAVRREVGATL